jgi:UDP-2,3-diacylglucosamine hydrolase
VTSATEAAAPQGAGAGGDRRLAIICGGGDFPIVLARAAIEAGRDPFLVGLTGSADERIEAFAHIWVSLGEVGKFLTALRDRGVVDVAMVGAIKRPEFGDLRFDLGAAKILPALAASFRGGDDTLLATVARLMEAQGFNVLAAHEVAPQLLTPPGVLTQISPSPQALADARRGASLIAALSPFDVGQAVVVANGRVLAVEAAEGTDGMLGRIAEMRASGKLRLKGRAGALVKCPKSAQELRVDLPAIGLNTIAAMREAQLEGVALASGKTLLIDRQALAHAADEASLFVYGMDW